MKRISLPWTTLIAYATGANKRFVPATGWLNAAGFTRVRAAFELVSAQTNFSATFAYQTANVEDNPDTAVEVGSAQTADGMNYGTLTDISNNTNGKQLVRFGWMCQNTNAAALIAAMSAGVVDFDAC